MDFCNDIKINMNIPININENDLFKHDPSNAYYNDICYSHTTEENTDIIIADRKKEFNDNNMSLCESSCIYKGYNTKTNKVSCECQTKNTMSLVSKIINNKDNLMIKFKDIKSAANINIIKCYYSVFKKDVLKSNIGSYILLSITFVEFILMIIFLAKGYYKFNNDIKEIFIENDKNSNVSERKNKQRKKRKKGKKGKKGKHGKNEMKRKNMENNAIKTQGNPPKNKNIKKNVIKINNNKRNNIKIKNIQITNNINSKNKDNNDNSLSAMNINKDKLDNNKVIIKNNDFELNNFTYIEALKLDKRLYSQYYLSLLKYKQLLIFTFYTSNDYNSKIIKICLFLFFFSLYYTVNTLFFNNETIHNLYIKKGEYDILYQIPQIIYSSLICSVIKIIISYFSLTEKNVIETKRIKEKLCVKIDKLFKCLTVKFLLFYILTYLFLILFWYYIACFCAVYKNSQIHVIKDTLNSFSLSLLYPFGLCLLPGIFRIISLRAKNGDKEFLYKFSKLLQMI